MCPAPAIIRMQEQQDDRGTKWVYIVADAECKRIKQSFEDLQLYDKSRRVERIDGDLAIPVTDQAVQIHHPTIDPQNFLQQRVQPAYQMMATRRPDPRDRLRTAVESLLLAKAVHLDAALELDIPRSWGIRGDLILLPDKAFRCTYWEAVIPELWETVCSCFGVSRVARQGAVKADKFRSPRVEILKGESGWVQHKENGIVYCYDVTKCMFSSGNISEKQWIGSLDCRNEVVVDLFAGIGYFTLPYLIHAKARHVHACEWNPDALIALKVSLAANQVSSRCTLYQGDNKEVAPQDVADRVNLGLIPSSEDSWNAACRCLKTDRGGWLHVHGNINLHSRSDSGQPDTSWSSEEEWMAYVVDGINRILSDLYRNESSWTVIGHGTRKVKSYGPHIWHMVTDVECRPVLPAQYPEKPKTVARTLCQTLPGSH